MVRGREEPVSQVPPDGGIQSQGLRLPADHAVVSGKLAVSAGLVLSYEMVFKKRLSAGLFFHKNTR